jgi:hypothetical protein
MSNMGRYAKLTASGLVNSLEVHATLSRYVDSMSSVGFPS